MSASEVRFPGPSTAILQELYTGESSRMSALFFTKGDTVTLEFCCGS
jgi:hypothetical protein